MKTPFIIILVIILVILILLFYYLMFIRKKNNIQTDIPHNMIYEYDINIIELFNNISKKYGDYPAIKYNIDNNWKTVSYYEYFNTSLTFAQKLSYYISPKSIVGILSNNRPEWFYIYMGTMIANGLPIGIYPSCAPDICSLIINESNIELLVIEDIIQLQKISDLILPSVKIILLIEKIDINDIINKELLENIHKNNPKIKIWFYQKFINKSIKNYFIDTNIDFNYASLDNIATIIYTSGTTGTPKGVVITHKNIMNTVKCSIHNIISRSNINIYMNERYVSYLPLSNIALQLMDIYIPLATVGTVYIVNHKLDDSLNNTLLVAKPTIFIGTPNIWDNIMENAKKYKYSNDIVNQLILNKYILQNIGLASAKYCITFGASIPQESIYFFNSIGIELCNIYGMSETTGPISMSVPGCSRGAGMPIMDIKIDNNTNEILVRGKSIFSNYHNDKIKNIINDNGWLYTGDTGYIDRDGSLFITGRIIGKKND